MDIAEDSDNGMVSANDGVSALRYAARVRDAASPLKAPKGLWWKSGPVTHSI